MARRTMQLLSPKVFNVYDRDGWMVHDERESCKSESKTMINDPLNGAVLWFSHYPEGYWKPDLFFASSFCRKLQNIFVGCCNYIL